MEGAACFINQKVPHGFSRHVMIKIPDKLIGVYFHALPTGMGRRSGFTVLLADTVFSQKKGLIGKRLVRQFQGVKMMAAVPMERYSPNIILCARNGKTVPGPFINPFLVMIPDHHFNIIKATGFKGRLKEFGNKYRFFFRGVYAAFPGLPGNSLVLNR